MSAKCSLVSQSQKSGLLELDILYRSCNPTSTFGEETESPTHISSHVLFTPLKGLLHLPYASLSIRL